MSKIKAFVICKVEADIVKKEDIGKIRGSKVIEVVAVVSDPRKIYLYTKDYNPETETFAVYPCNTVDMNIDTQASLIDIGVFKNE